MAFRSWLRSLQSPISSGNVFGEFKHICAGKPESFCDDGIRKTECNVLETPIFLSLLVGCFEKNIRADCAAVSIRKDKSATS